MELDRDLSSIQETRKLLKAARKAQDALKSFSRPRSMQSPTRCGRRGSGSLPLGAMGVQETGMGK